MYMEYRGRFYIVGKTRGSVFPAREWVSDWLEENGGKNPTLHSCK